jgi:ribonuclease HI
MNAADLAARMLREPFATFVLESKSGRSFTIAERWQMIVSEKSVVVGKPSAKHGVAEEFSIIPLAEIERVVDDSKKTPALPLGHVTSTNEMLKLYTDGACQGNPGPGGWGFIIKNAAGAEISRGSGGERPTTNNRMELTSVIRGLEAIDPAQSVKLITDSQYVAKGLAEWMKGWKARGWKRKTAKGLEPVANEDLWRRLDELTASRKIVCEWVRGHAGHPENEECDQMAVEAAMNV